MLTQVLRLINYSPEFFRQDGSSRPEILSWNHHALLTAASLITLGNISAIQGMAASQQKSERKDQVSNLINAFFPSK
jgi:hypothetical protein